MAETKTKTASADKTKTETPAAASDDTKKADSTASNGSDSDGAAAKDPSVGYSRGEKQKPISRAYKNNWDNIFGKSKGGGRR